MNKKHNSSDNERDFINSVFEFIIGIALVITGIILLLMNITVSTFGFIRFGNFDSAPVLIALLVILIIWAVLNRRTYNWVLVAVNILLIIVSVLVGTHFVFKHISLFTLLVMLGMFAVGVGLILRNVFYLKKNDFFKK